MNKNCVCIVSGAPNIEWLNFLSKFKDYDVYIVADDNSNNYSSIYKEFLNVKIIQFENEECEKYGFKGCQSGIARRDPKKKVFAWDKAFYYFAKINNSYEYVWFLEDDVFIFSETSLQRVDKKYTNQDLITKEISRDLISDDNLAYPKVWWWEAMYKIGNFKPENNFYKCANGAFHIRLSKKLIQEIGNHADKYKTLFFHEALVPVICMQNNLSFASPSEFKFSQPSCELDGNVKKMIFADGMKQHFFYHPIKDPKEHEHYRNQKK